MEGTDTHCCIRLVKFQEISAGKFSSSFVVRRVNALKNTWQTAKLLLFLHLSSLLLGFAYSRFHTKAKSYYCMFRSYNLKVGSNDPTVEILEINNAGIIHLETLAVKC